MRTKSIIYLLFLLVTITFSFGQIEKQKVSYRSQRIEKKSIEELLQDAEEVKEKDPEGALDIIKEALAISVTNEDYYHKAKCYILIGEINESIKEQELALENYDLAIEEFELALKTPLSNQKQIRANLHLSALYLRKGENQKANKAIAESEKFSSKGKGYLSEEIQEQKERVNLLDEKELEVIVLDTSSVGLNFYSESTVVGAGSLKEGYEAKFTISSNTSKLGVSDSLNEKIALSNTLFDNNDVEGAFQELDEAQELAEKLRQQQDKRHETNMKEMANKFK